MISFLILAVVAVLSAALVVATRNPVVSSLWLALTFVTVAGIFALLGAPFLAVIQIIVYAGAILVFFLFVIMLLGIGREGLAPRVGGGLQGWLGLYLAALIAICVAFAIQPFPEVSPAGVAPGFGETQPLAILLYSRYFFPFELASVLLTVAVVGAVVLARKRTQP